MNNDKLIDTQASINFKALKYYHPEREPWSSNFATPSGFEKRKGNHREPEGTFLFPSNEELNSSYTSTSVKKLNVTVFSIGGTKKYYSSSSKPFLDEITEQTNERGTYSQNIDPNMLSAPI